MLPYNKSCEKRVNWICPSDVVYAKNAVASGKWESIRSVNCAQHCYVVNFADQDRIRSFRVTAMR